MMKYIVYTLAKAGALPTVTISDYTNAASSNAVLTTVKGVSNLMEFMSTSYNIAGVENFTLKEDQFLLASANFSANIDVNSLANAFNLSYAQFLGHQVMVDNFGFNASELQRLSKLLADDPNYVAPTSDDLAALSNIGAVLVDRNFFMIFDNLLEPTNIYDPRHLRWNQFLHTWKTFSASPFANVCVFTTGEQTINSVAVTGETNVENGKTYQYTATVTASAYANKGVVWSVTGSTDPSTTISDTGLLYVGEDETAATVVATSTVDMSKSGNKVLTVG